VEKQAMVEADPVNPMRIFWELSARLPENAIVAADSGSAANWYARHLKFRGDMRGSLSGTLATMGSALPYALAAKVNHPGRPTLALVGDGAMQMSGLNALITVAEQWKSWRDPRMVIVVLNNRQLSYVTWEQRAVEGDPKFAPSQDLTDFPFARHAELLGLEATRVTSPDALQRICERAFHVDRPLLIEAVTDPNVPPLPNELHEKERLKLKHALAQRDDDLPAALEHLQRFTST